MDKRTFLAILLCSLLLVVYTTVRLPSRYPPQQKRYPSSQSPKKDTLTEKPKSPPIDVDRFRSIKKDIVKKSIETNIYKVDFNNKGGCIETITLKKFDDASKKGELKLIRMIEETKGAFLLKFPKSDIDLENEIWDVAVKDKSIEFSFVTGNMGVKKIFTLYDNTYNIDLKILISGKSDVASKVTFELFTFPGVDPDGSYRTDNYLQGCVGAKSGKIKYVSNQEAKIIKREEFQDLVWQGVKNRYFAGIVIFKDASLIDSANFYPLSESALKKEGGQKNIVASIVSSEFEVKANLERVFDFTIFVGPIRYEELNSQGYNLISLLDYGGVMCPDFIGYVIIFVLNLFFGIFKNYGVAIIFTTFVIRLLLFPLTKKSQVSAYKMQKLQPKLNALKERYKNDQRKMAQEQWKLFKEYGVNPLSGCLPLLLQMPIFFGMYSVAEISIELRHSPFVFWINDLSQPDRLCGLPFSILGATTLNMLPILMTVAWILQSALVPKSSDPQQKMQQNLMMFMPLLFMIFCYELASGLSLYFFINSLFGIVEQKIIKEVWLK